MKKILLPAALLIISVLSYFLFLAPGDVDDSTKNGSKDTAKGQTSAQDTAVIRPPSALEIKRGKTLREHARPEDFVDLEFDYKKNIFGESVIDGSLKNNAEYTSYRDFMLMIYFEDIEGIAVDSAAESVFEMVKPAEKIEFQFKEKGPRKAKIIRLRIANANVVEDED